MMTACFLKNILSTMIIYYSKFFNMFCVCVALYQIGKKKKKIRSHDNLSIFNHWIWWWCRHKIILFVLERIIDVNTW